MIELAAALVLWTAGYAYRLRRGDDTATLDGGISLLGEAWCVFSLSGDEDVSREAVQVAVALMALHAVLVTVMAFYITPCFSIFSTEGDDEQEKEKETQTQTGDKQNEQHKTRGTIDADTPTTELPQMHHLILPSRTTHARYTPTHHSFSYSYFLVGVPVPLHPSPTPTFPPLLSSDANHRHPTPHTFHVSAADHLARDTPSLLSLREKLDAYLRTQHADPAAYPHAYLVTAPRIFGYVFNPASFWYLYAADRTLAALLVEVNNTFDERRTYFLPRDDNNAPAAVGAPLGAAWGKDFHVSPFNDRSGRYTMRVADPRPWVDQAPGALHNRITLRTDAGAAKIMARVYSTGAAVDPALLSAAARCALVLRYGALGALTFPRILREAGTLYFARRLRVWWRPEVLAESLPRRASAAERELEAFFARYLAHCVAGAATPLRVRYRPRAGCGLGSDRTFDSACAGGAGTEEMELRPLSPAFYARFVHYAHALEAVDGEFLCAAVKSRTVSVSRPELVPKVFRGRRPPLETGIQAGGMISMDDVRWRLLRRLRCPAPKHSYPSPAPSSDEEKSWQKVDIRRQPYSELDLFVWERCPGHWVYRRLVTKLFVAERIALGFPGAITTVDVWLRVGATFLGWWWWITLLRSATRDPNETMGMARRVVMLRVAVFGAFLNGAFLRTILVGLLAINGNHIWSSIKGN